MLNMIYTFVRCFFMTWALERVFHLNTGNIMTAVILLLSYLLVKYTDNLQDMNELKSKRCTGILGALFAFIYVLFVGNDVVSDLSNRLFQLIIIIAVFAGLSILFACSLRFIYSTLKNPGLRKALFDGKEPRIKHIGLLSFGVTLALYLPYFLYQFPGIMTPDSINQYEQAMDMIEYSNHHPWIHTLIIKLFLNIGYIFTKDTVVAASFYTIAQMCFMAFVGAYVILTLKKIGFSEKVLVICMMFYALIPYNAVFAITVWKDVPFAGLTAIFIASLIRLDMDKDDRKARILDLMALCVSGFGFSTFRANAFYAYIVLVPFIILRYRRKMKSVIFCQIGVIIMVLLFKGPVMNAFNVGSTDFIESMAVPLQQLTYVIVNDRPIDDADMKEITNVIDTTYIKELYALGCADNMKELVRAGHEEYLVANKSTFLKIYVKYGFKYFGDYVDAYTAQIHGFLFPDREYMLADTEGVIASDTGITSRPLIAGPIVIKTKEILIKLADIIPIYGLSWSMGTVFWVTLIAVGFLIVTKNYKSILYYIPLFLLMLTLFVATPLAEEYRYSFFLLTCLPLIILTVFIDDNNRSVL